MLQELQMNRVTQELLGPKRKSALEERQLREKLESENKQEVFQRQRELQSLGHIRASWKMEMGDGDVASQTHLTFFRSSESSQISNRGARV